MTTARPGLSQSSDGQKPQRHAISPGPPKPIQAAQNILANNTLITRGHHGEERFYRRFPDEVSYYVMGEGYTWNTQDRERDVAKAEAAWAKARELLADASIGLVLFDELNIALKLRYLDVNLVVADLQTRPPMQHVVITGRGAPPELIEAADTVTDMTLVKHAFKAGVKAMPGVEF